MFRKSSARRGARRGGAQIGLTKAILSAAGLVAVVFGAVTGVVGYNLLSIDELARSTRDVAIPTSIEQNARALATEEMRRLARAIAAAESAEIRAEQLAEAEGAAASLANLGKAELDELAAGAVLSVQAVAAAADAADGAAREIDERLQAVDGAIKDLDNALASIAEDSQSQVEELFEKIGDSEGRRQARYLKKLGKLYRINAASQNLVSGLRLARTGLANALSAATTEDIEAGRTNFAANMERVKVLLGKLPSTGDYEYLPELIDRIGAAAAVFDQRLEEIGQTAAANEAQHAALGALQSLGAELSTAAAAGAIASVEKIVERVEAIQWSAALGIAILVALSLGAFVIAVRKVVRPLIGVSDALRNLSAGEDAKVIAPSQVREIQMLRGAIVSFSAALEDMERMAAEKEETDAARKLEMKAAMDRLAGAFETKVLGVVEGISTAAEGLSEASATMTDKALEATRIAGGAKTLSEASRDNVQSVAAAAEEMSATVAEISSRISATSEQTKDANSAAARAVAQVRGLREAAAVVDEVTKQVTTITEQTNLLALNATIEAARAGAAGKGFAVVASEVKTLAGATAKAAMDIGTQIGAIQEAVDATVPEIERIAGLLAKTTSAAAEIAESVSDQNEATAEIAQNAERAADGSQVAADRIVEVSATAEASGAVAQDVDVAAMRISDGAKDLSLAVEGFLADIRSYAA